MEKVTRNELLKSKEYWMVKIQNDLYSLIEDYIQKNDLNRTELAKKIGVTKGYITQVLKGDFDHKISKLVDLSLAVDKIPVIKYADLDTVIKDDEAYDNPLHSMQVKPIQYITFVDINSPSFSFKQSDSFAATASIRQSEVDFELSTSKSLNISERA